MTSDSMVQLINKSPHFTDYETILVPLSFLNLIVFSGEQEVVSMFIGGMYSPEHV